MTNNNLIEEIQNLSLEEKEDLKDLIDKYLIEEKREIIYKNYEESSRELKEGKLKFSNDIDELKRHLEE